MSTAPIRKVLAISGSIKSQSANQQLLKTIAALAEQEFDVEIFNGLSSLPYFNPDDTDNAPQSVVDFRNRIEAADAVIICTPEYVFSLPGILKNALEWLVSTTILTDKPAALITASSSGKIAHESLLLVMKTLGVKTSKNTCLLIQSIKSRMTKEGTITDEETVQQIKILISTLSQLLHANH